MGRCKGGPFRGHLFDQSCGTFHQIRLLRQKWSFDTFEVFEVVLRSSLGGFSLLLGHSILPGLFSAWGWLFSLGLDLFSWPRWLARRYRLRGSTPDVKEGIVLGVLLLGLPGGWLIPFPLVHWCGVGLPGRWVGLPCWSGHYVPAWFIGAGRITYVGLAV